MGSFAFAAGLAALVAVSNATTSRPVSREDMMVEASRLAEYQKGFESVVPFYLDHAVPSHDAECKAVSRTFAQTCRAVDCSSIGSTESKVAQLCCRHVCDGAGDPAKDPCRWTDVESCDEASWELKKEFAGTETGECCNTCAFERPTDGSFSDAYKASCTTDGYQGHAVCGAVTGTAAGPTPNTDVYFKGGCSVGPEFTLTGSHEDCHWDDARQEDVCTGTTCEAKYTDYGLDTFLKAVANGVDPVDVADSSDAARDVSEGLFGVATRAFVVNDPVQQASSDTDTDTDLTFEKAKIVVSPVDKDDHGNQCFASVIEAYTESEIHITSGQTWMYNPTATKDSTITLSGSASVGIVGGNSAGAIYVRGSEGRVRLAGITNSGPVTFDGASNIFVSGVVNNVGGRVIFSNTAASIYGTTNHADIVVDGSQVDAYQIANTGSILIKGGSFNLEFCSNTGSVTVERCDGVCTVSAPEGSNLIYPPTVTFVAYSGPPCGETTLPVAPPLPRPPSAAFQCIEDRCDDEHAHCSANRGCSELYELTKQGDRAPTAEEVDALEGADRGAFDRVNQCYKDKCQVEKPPAEEPSTTVVCAAGRSDCNDECRPDQFFHMRDQRCVYCFTDPRSAYYADGWGCTEHLNDGDEAGSQQNCIDRCPVDVPVCTCTKEFVPVCGTNSVTYGNECEARCAHQHDFTNGECGYTNVEPGTGGLTAIMVPAPIVIRGRVVDPYERDQVLGVVSHSLESVLAALRSLLSGPGEPTGPAPQPSVYPFGSCGHHQWGADQDGGMKCGGRTPYTMHAPELHAMGDSADMCCSHVPRVEPGTGGPMVAAPHPEGPQ